MINYSYCLPRTEIFRNENLKKKQNGINSQRILQAFQIQILSQTEALYSYLQKLDLSELYGYIHNNICKKVKIHFR